MQWMCLKFDPYIRLNISPKEFGREDVDWSNLAEDRTK